MQPAKAVRPHGGEYRGVAIDAREEEKAEATIADLFATLKSALNWAVDVGMLAARRKSECPNVRRVKSDEGASGHNRRI